MDIKKQEAGIQQYLMLIASLTVFLAVTIILAYKTQFKSPGDYLNYYYGSTFLFQGISTESIYDPASFNKYIATEGIEHAFSNYTPVPPFSLLFYYPFTLIEFSLSKLIFNILSLCIFIFSLYRLCIELAVKPWIICTVLFVLIYPIYNNLVQGQSYLLIIALLIEGYLFSLRGKVWFSALFFAIPITLKLFPAILMLWLFFAGRKKEFFLTIIFTGVLSFSVIPFMGIDSWLKYHISILPRLISGEINDPFSVTYQSYAVLLKKVFVYDKMLNPFPVVHALWLMYVFTTIISAVCIHACIQFLQNNNRQLFLCFGMVFLCGLTVSGYGTNYSLVLLLFIAIACLSSDVYSGFYKVCLLILICITAFFQSVWFSNFPVELQFGRLYSILIIFFLLIKGQRIVWFSKTFFFLLLLLLIPIVLKYVQKKDHTDYYLTHEPSLFITSYDIVPEGIHLSYIGKEGSGTVVYKTKDHISISDQLYIKNNQVYEGTKQITFGKDLKKQPAYLNTREIIYLSDYGRGPGLTTLRKLKLHE